MSNKIFSDWMRVDLHIHTDWSKKTKNNDYKGIFSVTTLKDKLKENQVQIFSMTDHNIINLEAYNEYYDSYNETEDPLLLLGVELDIIVEGGRPEAYHSLLIFNYTDKANAKRLHDLLESKYAEKEIDIFKRVLTIGEIVQLFPDEDFFFIPHAGNTRSILDSYKDDINTAQKMVLLMQSAFEKVPEKNVQRYNDGFDKHLVEAFRKKDDNAYVQFSDNHNAANYPCTGKEGDNHEYYYLKGSQSFETLRLAFIDPKSRIKSAEQIIELSRQTNYIEKVRISGNSVIDDTELSFSPHLNVLIGGRSSGKSLMMTLLGEKVDGVDTGRNVYDINFGNAEIKSSLDASFQVKTSIEKEQVTYIKQNEIVKYFEKENLLELAKSAGKEDEYNFQKRKFIQHKSDLSDRLEELLDKYNQIGGQAKFVRGFKLHATTIESILSNEYVFNFDYDQVFDTNDKSELIEDSLESISNLTAYTKEFKENEFLDFTEIELETIEEFESLILVKESLIQKKSLIQNRKDYFLESSKDLLNEQNQQLSLNARKKAESITLLSNLKRDIGDRFTRLKELKNATKSFENFDYSLEKELLIAPDVKLIMEVENSQSLKELFLDGIGNANSGQSIYLNLLGVFLGDKKIKSHNDIQTETLRRKSRRQLKDVDSTLEAPKDYLKYEDESTSKRNSPGFNSEKYLQIILSNPNSQFVFVDQPEDNLGNKFIAKTLVEILRRIKFKKQVFLVTHNPSIVVYGDAENVIIANNDGSKISYKQHVIEDPFAQKEICNILDGGEYIFDMRSKKYNIQKLLKEANNE
jgi:DNA repair ATPase RecN